jgi:hypothetical protein
MSYSIAFNFRKIAFFSMAVAFFCLFSEVSFAQEDMGKAETDMIKPVERSNSHVSPSANEANSTIPVLNRSLVPSPKIGPTKKEPGLVGEGKKPESAPSTLNFNIFLYIVDKFKAD